MADNDTRGQFAVILAILESDGWRGIWRQTSVELRSFDELGLKRTAPDALVWQRCQEHEIILITGNRNSLGADSLEATIRTYNEPTSLPVITIADPKQLMRSKAYAERAAVRLLDYLMDLDNQRGTGRLYIP